MSETNWSEYDEFLGDANRDDRVGDHDFMVSEVLNETWPSGDPRLKVKGVLRTANNAQCDLTWSPPPAASILKEQQASMDRGKKRAIANAISVAKNLAQFYGKRLEELKAGDVIRVKTAKTKIVDGKGGFIRIVQVLPADQVGKASGITAADIPF